MIQAPSFTQLETWSLPAALAFSGLALGLAVRRFVLPRAARWAAKSAWKYDDIMVDAVRGPVVVWFVLIGLRVAVRRLPLPAQVDDTIGTIALVLGIFSVTWAVGRFAAGALRTAAATGGYHAVSLLANIARALVFAVGLLVMLSTLGISITPLITALGVGGLAVGLALQDTLANFFAGIRILMAGKIRPGDFVRLESGQEGYVEDITWGQTTIRQPAHSLVIVPNAKLSTAITINYNLPAPPQTVVIPVGVGYDSDLDQVERVTLEVATAMQRGSAYAVADFEPSVRFHTFGDSSIGVNVALRARTFEDRVPLAHEFIKALHARYRTERIEMPFPQRVIQMRSGSPAPGAQH